MRNGMDVQEGGISGFNWRLLPERRRRRQNNSNCRLSPFLTKYKHGLSCPLALEFVSKESQTKIKSQDISAWPSPPLVKVTASSRIPYTRYCACLRSDYSITRSHWWLLNRTTIIDVSRVEFDLVKYCCALDVKACFMCCTDGFGLGTLFRLWAAAWLNSLYRGSHIMLGGAWNSAKKKTQFHVIRHATPKLTHDGNHPLFI